MIAIDLSKEEELDSDPKAIQEITFTVNFEWARNVTRVLHSEAKETVLYFSQGNIRAL